MSKDAEGTKVEETAVLEETPQPFRHFGGGILRNSDQIES